MNVEGLKFLPIRRLSDQNVENWKFDHRTLAETTHNDFSHIDAIGRYRVVQKVKPLSSIAHISKKKPRLFCTTFGIDREINNKDQFCQYSATDITQL